MLWTLELICVLLPAFSTELLVIIKSYQWQVSSIEALITQHETNLKGQKDLAELKRIAS